SDIKRVYRILDEVVELGHDPSLWRPHLARQLQDLLQFQMTTIYMMPLPMNAAAANIMRIDSIGLDEAGHRAWLEYGQRGDLSDDPCTPAIQQRAGHPFTSVRQMLAPDRDWYRSSYYNEFRHLTHSDDILVSLLPMPDIGILHGIGGDRAKGSKPMGRREIVCAGLIHNELARKWRRAFAARPLAERMLPPRLAELLGYLRGPKSEKEIAHEMGLSAHTVHNHIRRLYKKFKVASRTELLVAESRSLVGVPRLGVAGL
ncbi:MAG TPA: LuxR C-terminal-related transcriptional regulator, partial [Tepidisphaeraceae bacterium]|nr:LuxR C-terminal-related transcriptional regulator [Tepidisphaeraceae bacterium]